MEDISVEFGPVQSFAHSQKAATGAARAMSAMKRANKVVTERSTWQGQNADHFFVEL